jgi:protein TonB
MDFTQDGGKPSRNIVGIGVVVLLHVILVYALVTGLARKVVDVIQQPVETKIVDEYKPPPPPPPKEPPPPPKRMAPPPPFVPPPEVKVQPPPQAVIATVSNVKPPTNDLPPVAPPAPPAPPPVVHTSAKLGGDCAKPAYPVRASQNGEEGTVGVKLTIGADGSVIDAVVEKSSGYGDLDRATQKAWSLCHFTPAMSDGQAIQSTARIQYVWKLQ